MIDRENENDVDLVGFVAPPPSKFLREGADIPTILSHMKKDLSDTPLQLRCLLAIERLVESEGEHLK